ncbi:MAG TPA: cytochrome c oxidase assembly protein [Bryobacteraceae bacterium]|nr:cytochrome c oxidase assembly protein [Bryobacteraceae bacterium]
MTWDFKPSVVIGCCVLLGAYFGLVRWRARQAALWLTGVLLIFMVLCSPIDELADSYLFSVHMAKHILLVLVVPALLVMAVPADVFERALRYAPVRAAERVLRVPAIAWMAGVGVMIFWHIPALFNTALTNEPLHIVEHLSLLVGGTIYWWPVLTPLPQSRMRPVPQAAAYLFTSCLACTAIGVAITFAPALLYPAYAHPPAGAVAEAIRGRWGISAAMDQQIGGLLMWVPACLVYLTAILAMFARWYREEPEPAMEV